MSGSHVMRADPLPPISNDGQEPLVDVAQLTIDYWQEGQWVNVVRDVSFSIMPGEVFGLAGESGCGKTTVALALLGYHQPGSRIREGQVRFRGNDLLDLPERDLAHLRGARLGFVPQDPSTALSPHMPAGEQLVETLLAHEACASRIEAQLRTCDLLAQVAIAEPERALRRYPHQFSGGQQQRILIALALACKPDLIVLDEPTTALDVTTQAQILQLLGRLRADYGLAMLYVTHNLGVMASIADRVGVMYAGELVESAPIAELFRRPIHPYTQGLIAAVPKVTAPTRQRQSLLRGLLERDKLPPGCRFAPRCDRAEPACFEEAQQLAAVEPGRLVACRLWRQQAEGLTSLEAQGARPAAPAPAPVEDHGAQREEPLLVVHDLACTYEPMSRWLPVHRKPRQVVRDVGFEISAGETFALVGESGSGKSTIARAVSGLLLPVHGSIRFAGQDATCAVERRPSSLRRAMQIVFQNPAASLNPRQRVSVIIGRPLEKFFGLRGRTLRQRVVELLDAVHLDIAYAERFADQLSGGEQQRVAIARALAAEPQLMLCDEILSALDVSVQASVLDLLRNLQATRHMAYLFISHDLAVVRSIADRVGVFYQGEMWELGKVEEVFTPPSHPYTESLLAVVPEANPDWRPRQNVALQPGSPEPARVSRQLCPFAERCAWRTGRACHERAPEWQQVSPTHFIRCHVAFEELLAQQLTPRRAEIENALPSHARS